MLSIEEESAEDTDEEEANKVVVADNDDVGFTRSITCVTGLFEDECTAATAGWVEKQLAASQKKAATSIPADRLRILVLNSFNRIDALLTGRCLFHMTPIRRENENRPLVSLLQ